MPPYGGDSEKSLYDVSTSVSSTPYRISKPNWTIRIITSIFGLVALYHFIQTFLSSSPTILVASSRSIQEGVFDWAGLQPSQDLKWHKCYDGKFDCARLDVPLDWLEPSEDERVVLAVIRAPAKSREDYRGPVFVNPGGPGGSGVSWLADGTADHLQTIVGNNHDIVSWDPRGVGASVPRIDCWGSSQKRHDWGMQMSGVVDSHPGMLFDALAQFDAMSRQCETHMNATTPSLLSHISTASHTRDMLEISEKMGFRTVKYWGVSYGTILGGTFGALYPDRVERLVSDGNVDYQDWFANIQLNYLQDADKIMEAFFEFCNKAGPDRCAFYQPTAEAVEERFLALLDSLRKIPVLIPAQTNGTQLEMPELVTYSKLQNLIRSCMYKPIYRFPALATAMAALEERNGVPYYQLRNEDDGDLPLLNFCTMNETLPTIPSVPQHSEDAFPAIMCADGDAVPADEWTPDSFLTYFGELQRISKYAGASNVQSKLSCAGRQVRPKWRYAGPFQNITTAFPILFIGNIADNVTPLLSARNNSRAFPGSAVLVQRSYGHASLAAPSTCTARVIRSYFQEGRLPQEGLECDQDWELFEDPPPLVMGAVAERELGFAVRELSRKAEVAIL
ncbi:putative TAP-like protein-domain-containing protein [Seiridium unicorne]|uniref:TAP-like protein-domain-containing protein n=1 Tax=Seiridium unicorne TaxID=138068 RepID=A0ABR2VHR0_9PEZI